MSCSVLKAVRRKLSCEACDGRFFVGEEARFEACGEGALEMGVGVGMTDVGMMDVGIGAAGETNLQVIISPAKKMRAAHEAGEQGEVAPRGIPPFPERTARIIDTLRDMDRDELQALWGVSDALADESVARMDAFELATSFDEACQPRLAGLLTPAIFTYEGIQYKSLAPEVLDDSALEWLQAHLWVLSGLYGCVRPYDAVMPYRLEMGARLSVDGSRDLYDFWGADIARAVTGTRSPLPVCIVNLASVEYAKAVLPHAPTDSTRVVTCIFGETFKGGKPVQRSTASKIARGSMVRWLAERQTGDPADLPLFDVGYRFDDGLSTPDTLVFMKA